MGKLISCWSEAAKTLLSPRVLLRTACQEFHSPQSIWRPFRDQTLSWPEPSWATQLIRSSPLLSNFPSLSLSNSHPLCLLPNYSPLMRTSVGRKQNWEEVFLSQNKYFPELHNLNQPGSITYVALPESISCLYCIAIFFGKSTELIVLIVLRVSCAKNDWQLEGKTLMIWQCHYFYYTFDSLQRNAFLFC